MKCFFRRKNVANTEVSQALEAGSIAANPSTSRSSIPEPLEAGSSTSAVDSAEMYFLHEEKKLLKKSYKKRKVDCLLKKSVKQTY